MTFASATTGCKSPTMFLNCREENRQEKAPLVSVWIPELQLGRPVTLRTPVELRPIFAVLLMKNVWSSALYVIELYVLEA